MTNPADQTAQAAANTPCGLSLPPLAAFWSNRIEQLMAHLDLPIFESGDFDSETELYEQLRTALETAYQTGFQDANLRLGDL